jgi:hypothetical protein
VPSGMKEAVVGIESDRAKCREAILQQDRVGEGQQGIDGILGRPAITAFEVETAAGGGGL